MYTTNAIAMKEILPAWLVTLEYRMIKWKFWNSIFWPNFVRSHF